MTRIYVLGEARGAHRIQSFIKLLLDNRKQFKVYYDTLFYSNPLLRYLKSLLINPFVILRSNMVYVCTLNVDVNIFYELLWAKLLRKKILVDCYVSVYDTVVLDRKWFSENSFLAKMANLCDKLFLRLANKVIFLTEEEGNYYISLAGIEESSLNTCIIPLGVAEQIKLDCHFVNDCCDAINICWWGSYIPLHGIDTLLKSAKLLKEKGLPVRWYFFGNDSEKGKPYTNLMKEYGLEDVCQFSDDYTFSNGRLQTFLKEHCDIALGHFGESQKSNTVISNKLLEACSMKCVVLTGASNTIAHYFSKGEENIFMSERTPEGIAKKILEIYQTDKAILKARIDNTYQLYLQEYTIPVLIDRFRRVIDEMVNQK